MKRSLISLAFCAVVLAAAPMHAQAADATFLGPIVPAECKCDNQQVLNADGSPTGQTVATAPDYGCVLQVVQNIINFGITLSTILFTIYLVIAGLSFITSGSSSEARSKAKTRFMNVFIGLAVLLTSWLLIDYVMKTVYEPDSMFGPWNAILAPQADGSDRCIVAKQPNAVFTGTVDIVNGGATTATGGTGSTGMDVSRASAYALQHAKSSSGGQCALYVRLALAAGGLTSFNANHPGYAYQYPSYLQNAGFTLVSQGTYSPQIENKISGLQPGDVVVFQPIGSHKAGHIAIYTGTKWVSDYVQKTMSSNPSDYSGGAYAIYRP